MKRSEKLREELSRQVSKAISEIFPLDESGVFTIRNIDLLSDFSQLRIWISRVGGDPDFFERLEHAKNKIKKITFSRISLMKTPELVFHEDFTGEYAQGMEELLRK